MAEETLVYQSHVDEIIKNSRSKSFLHISDLQRCFSIRQIFISTTTLGLLLMVVYASLTVASQDYYCSVPAPPSDHCCSCLTGPFQGGTEPSAIWRRDDGLPQIAWNSTSDPYNLAGSNVIKVRKRLPW